MPKLKSSLSVWRLFLGCLFLVLGVIGGFIPFLQGWIFIILGVILLKHYLPGVRKLSIWLRKKHPHIRTLYHKIHRSIHHWLSKLEN